MKRRFLPLLALALLAASLPSVTRGQSEAPAQQHDNPNREASALKLIKSPPASFPAEAVKKNIEGKVVLSIVVDANGKVSDATALTGPPELFQAAIDNVKQWEFEPPARAPVATKAEVTFGYYKECPGQVSDVGEVIASNRVTNERGMVLDIADDAGWRLPYYPTEERKAGVVGEMVLSVR
jgi:TonB family protein